jgi:hypothetical protein
VIGEAKVCVKPPTSSGICTISSRSNGPQQDWLVCPYRALDQALVEDVARRLFKVPEGKEVLVKAAPTLEREAVRAEIAASLAAGNTTLAYVQDKIGGEISLAATKRSPELSFDITLVELTRSERNPNVPAVGRYGILEVQTMDFHGTYSHVVKNLEDALRLHGDGLPGVLRANLHWLSDHIEGPNIANVFKRTFYQMMLKFQIGKHGACAGTALAIPRSVWDSWQRHLGAPDLELAAGGTFKLRKPGHDVSTEKAPAWIYVFDVDAGSGKSPNPITIHKVIATDAASVAYFAFEVAPEAALEVGGSADRLLDSIRSRLSQWWPELGPAKPPRGTVRARRARPGES